MSDKSILVSGGLGFIGYHLCLSLLDRFPGVRLTIVDNLSSTKLDYSDLEGRANIVVDDLRNLRRSADRFDEIYHLASPVGSLGILDRNGYIALDIIELATEAATIASLSGARLVYISSSEVYGRDGRHQESSEQIVPPKRGTRMEYALGKLTAEHVLLNLSLDGQFEVRIVRPFNAIGEHQSADLGFVVPKFFESALLGDRLQVHGDGSQKRSFCHVSDLVDGVIAVQERGKAGQIYNVGHPDNTTTIEDLAYRIRAMCRSDSKVVKIDPREVYGNRFIEAFDKIPNIDLVKEHTGWCPMYTLQDGLERIHGWYLQKLQNKVVGF